MHATGRITGWLLLAALAGSAAAQEPEHLREDGRIWRTGGGQRWAVDGRLASLRLTQGDFAAWRASQAAGSSLGRLTHLRTNRLGWIDVAIPAGEDALDVLARLRSDPRVQAAELSAAGSYSGVPDDTQFGLQWALRNHGQFGGTPGADVGAVTAWDVSVGDPSVVLAIVDSGTEITHPDLAANVWSNSGEVPANGLDDDGNGFVDDVHGWDFQHADGNVAGPSFHGTATAGVALARTNNALGVSGIAGGFHPTDGCRGMILAVGDTAPQSALLDDAILYAADNGARVISMSLEVPPSAAIDAAIAYAHDVRGVALVAAAGNSGGAVKYPANQARVIAAGASDNQDLRWGGSCVGPELWVLAPGDFIRTTTTGASYTYLSGTSLSTPLVAGTLGLLFAKLPGLSHDDAREILKRTAKDLGVPGFDPQSGWGRLSAAGALLHLAASDCDGDGVYDPRQIANGSSLDLNQNGIPDECEQTVHCTAKLNSLGCTPQIGSSGFPRASASQGFLVSATQVRNQCPGLLMYGLSGRAALPFGGGTLCVAAPVRRSIVVSSGGSPQGADCSGVLALDMNAFAAGSLGGAPHPSLSIPGTLVNCQWWSSDPLPGAPSNPSLSDALEYSVAP